MDGTAGTSGTSDGGNSNPPSDVTKQRKYRRYCFTINNWNMEHLEHLEHLGSEGNMWVAGEEVAPTTGTPHLQCYIRFKSPRKWQSIIDKDWGWNNLQRCRGSELQNFKYCTKEENWHGNLTEETCIVENGGFRARKKIKEEAKEKNMAIVKDSFIKVYEDVKWKPWQQQCIDIVEGPVDRRKINWFWETEGNKGKTFLADYLSLKYITIRVDGKKCDVLNQLREVYAIGIPAIVIVDIARNEFNCFNPALLEKLQQRFVYSGKYEGDLLPIPDMHVIVFANYEPDPNWWSKDRYNIIYVDE